MTCGEAMEIWDLMLDEPRDSEVRKGFEQHLSECEVCAAKWNLESAWLGRLAETDVNEKDLVFVGGVIERWEANRAGSRRLLLSSRVLWPAAAAAVAAMVLVAVYWSNPRPPVVNTPVAAAAPPVGDVMRDFEQQINRQPQRIRDAVETTAAMLDVNRLSSIIELPWDMEQLLAPTTSPATRPGQT